MEEYKYDIECDECCGKKYITYSVDGNDSITEKCDKCRGMGEVEIDALAFFEGQLCDIDMMLDKVVKVMEKNHELPKGEIKKFLDGWLRNYKKEI